nr:hypothetical protein BaRGS_019195 [Batillaria attramentaria]
MLTVWAGSLADYSYAGYVNQYSIRSEIHQLRKRHYRSRILDDWPGSLIDTLRHYRSRILDDWPSSSIDTVRLTLYENGVQQRFVEFDGSGSNLLNWFTQARVVNSDWTDISNETANFFSIAGVNFPDVPAVRRFYINRSFGQNCDDQGWLLVAEADDVCDYVPPPPYPVIIYSGATTSTGVGMIT